MSERLRTKQRFTPRLGGKEGWGLACGSQGSPYLTLQGVSFLGPGQLQVFRQRRELVAPCAVVVVAGQGLGLPGMDQVHHVHGQVALRLAAHRLPPVLVPALQLAHPLAVLEPPVIVYTPGADQPPSLLHKVMSVEKLEGGRAANHGLALGLREFRLCVFIIDPRKITCSYTRR